MYLNSRTPRDLRHFGNPKNEKMLIIPIFMGGNEFPVEMYISQLITKILSFFNFKKISWPIFLSKLQKNWGWHNIFETTYTYVNLANWSKFWKSTIQQLTYEQYAVYYYSAKTWQKPNPENWDMHQVFNWIIKFWLQGR